MNRTVIEAALADLVTNQRGIDFQRIAIPLARQRCPQIVANEVTKDSGSDGFLVTMSLDEKRVLAVGCSLTATWAKIRDDLTKVKARNSGVTAFWFYTARKVTAELADKWREKAKQDFGVDLTVFSREEIVQRLVEPQNNYLTHLHLGILAFDPTGLEGARAQLAEFAQRRIDEWLNRHTNARLQPVSREYSATGDEHEGIHELVTVEGLADVLIGGGIFLVSGEGGLGKTVALGQIASALLRHEHSRIPLLASASSWARSGQSLFPYLANLFLGPGDANAIAMQGLTTRGQLAVFLNGWNEVPAEHLQRLSEFLNDAIFASPGCTIVVASRGLPGESLGRIARYNLSKLSAMARRTLVEQLGPTSANAVLTVIEQDSEIEALSRLPLFLVPLVDTISRGEAVPRRRYALLEAAITSIERMPEHHRVLTHGVMRTRYRPALSRLAMEMSMRGTTEATRDEAISWLTDIAGKDMTSGELLETLVQHHVLVSEAGHTIRFQHQYFQDWFCAQQLRQLTEPIAPYLDDRRLGEAWTLLAEGLMDEPSAAGTANHLFRSALDVDFQLAAEWVPILCAHLRRELIDELRSRLQNLMGQGDDGVKLALRCALAARLDDFADQFWRRLESDDQQLRLSTYRMLEPFAFPIEVLGPDWRIRVGRWALEKRIEFAIEAAGDSFDLIKDFATKDPSPMVRAKCVAHIAYYDQSAAARLFPATEEAVTAMLEYGTLELLPRDAVAKHLPYIERLASEIPPSNLGSRALSYLREIDPARAVDQYKQQLSRQKLDHHHERDLLERIAQYDRPWVGRYVIQKLVALEYLPEDLDQFLADLEEVELTEGVEQILANPAPPSNRLATSLAPFLRLGRTSTINRCLDELVRLGPPRGDSYQSLTEAQRNRLHDLERALRNTPVSTLVEVFAGRHETLTDMHSLHRAIDILASSASGESDGILPTDSPSGRALGDFVRKLGEVVLAADDPEGHRKAALARLIGNTGYSSLRCLLQKLIAAETSRVIAFCKLRAQQRSGALMWHGQWYVKALSQVSGADRISDLMTLFENEIFELEAGQELVRLVGLPFVSGGNGAWSGTDWPAVAAEHTRIGERNPPADAQAVAIAVQKHITAWTERTDAPVVHGPRESRIANIEVMHAQLTGHVRPEPLLAVASNHYSVHTVIRWLHTLLRCGVTVPSAVADAALQTWLLHLKTGWEKPEDTAHLIREVLIAMMFSDNLALATERISEMLPKLTPRWEAREILIPLAVSAVPKRVELLLTALPDGDGDSYWHEWGRAVALLPAADKREIVNALLTDARHQAHLDGKGFQSRGVIEVLASTVQTNDSLQKTLKSVAFSDTASPIRNFARHLFVASGTPKSALVALQEAMKDPTLRPFAAAVIRHSRWHYRPDCHGIPDHNAPQALSAVRKQLFHVAYRDEAENREAARQMLLRLESSLEGNYPVDEPRHPDLGLGLPWPFTADQPTLKQADNSELAGTS